MVTKRSLLFVAVLCQNFYNTDSFVAIEKLLLNGGCEDSPFISLTIIDMFKIGCILDNYFVDMSSAYQYRWADQVSSNDNNEYLPYRGDYRRQYTQVFKFDYGEWMWNVYQYNGVNYLGATNIYKYRRYDGKLLLIDCIKFINSHVKETKDVYRCFEFDNTFKKYSLLIKHFK